MDIINYTNTFFLSVNLKLFKCKFNVKCIMLNTSKYIFQSSQLYFVIPLKIFLQKKLSYTVDNEISQEINLVSRIET